MKNSSQSGDPEFDWQIPADEWDAIALNYTSGTTGDPKGVVYHHRGAYLNARQQCARMGYAARMRFTSGRLPLFHCNGWCFPWTVAERAGVNVCLRRVEAKTVFDAIRGDGITHYCGAPIVYSMLINAPAELRAEHHAQVEAGRGRGASAPRSSRAPKRSASI